MASYELRTGVLNGYDLYLFDEQGNEIALPPDNEWKLVYHPLDRYGMDPDHIATLDLKAGKYWLIESNPNVTTVYLLIADETTVQRRTVSGVANDFPEQEPEIKLVADQAPQPIVDRFVQLGNVR